MTPNTALGFYPACDGRVVVEVVGYGTHYVNGEQKHETIRTRLIEIETDTLDNLSFEDLTSLIPAMREATKFMFSLGGAE